MPPKKTKDSDEQATADATEQTPAVADAEPQSDAAEGRPGVPAEEAGLPPGGAIEPGDSGEMATGTFDGPMPPGTTGAMVDPAKLVQRYTVRLVAGDKPRRELRMPNDPTEPYVFRPGGSHVLELTQRQVKQLAAQGFEVTPAAQESSQ